MKKLTIAIILFTLFSCNKNQNMNHIEVHYNGQEYSSYHYQTITEFIDVNMSNDTKMVKVTMDISDTSGFIFTYAFSDNHSLIMKENSMNKYISSFVGNIIYQDDVLKGSAYDRNGNYILFSEI
jgi:FlaG/FlaF family flagellin (archaellin)